MQGLAADVQPYIFFFLFSGTTSLTCTNCTLEHSCGGGDASFFLQSMRLVRPRPLCSRPRLASPPLVTPVFCSKPEHPNLHTPHPLPPLLCQ